MAVASPDITDYLHYTTWIHIIIIQVYVPSFLLGNDMTYYMWRRIPEINSYLPEMYPFVQHRMLLTATFNDFPLFPVDEIKNGRN